MSLFQMSVAGGVLILFIVVIRALAIHRLPIRGHGLAVLLVDLGAERLDLLRQFLLLLLIPPRHSGETVIREFAGNIILIDPLEQAVQLLIAGLQGFQLFRLQLSVGGLCLLGMADHSLHKLILKLTGKFS